jgi:hypothetical protein
MKQVHESVVDIPSDDEQIVHHSFHESSPLCPILGQYTAH